MRQRQGFTLIELIMIIVIIGILAVVAIPRYVDLQAQAKLAAELGTVGAVRSGIMTSFANANGTFPASLESGACCFGEVLEYPVGAPGWVTTDNLTYTGPTGLNNYTYTPGTGTFE